MTDPERADDVDEEDVAEIVSGMEEAVEDAPDAETSLDEAMSSPTDPESTDVETGDEASADAGDEAPLSELADSIASEPTGDSVDEFTDEPTDAEEKHTFEGHEHVPEDRPSEATPEASAEGDTGVREDAPMSGLAERVRERKREPEPSPEDEELFEEMGVEEIDSDELWDSLLGDEEFDEESFEPDSTAVDERGIEYIVDKSQYCERCPYFSDPPESVCTHEGTSIVEVVDMEQFRVENCPFAGGETAPSFDQYETDV